MDHVAQPPSAVQGCWHSRGRLTDVARADDFDQLWTLDAAGNFSAFDDDGTSQTRTVDEANQIESIIGGWITPDYDAAGNMISGPMAGSETTRIHYIYDAWNRLVEVRDDDLGEPDDLIAQYEYDAANRRIEKVVAGGAHVHYFYDGWQMVDEQSVDGQGATVARNEYVWSPRYVDAPLVRFHDANGDGDVEDVGDNTRYYTSDANHNVTAAFDLDTGVVAERYVYTPYGEATVYSATWTNPAAPTTDGPLYAGYFYDAETGLYQVRHRYYHAELGTFVSRDPLGYDAGDGNLYRYCVHDPVSATDPTGLIDKSSVFAKRNEFGLVRRESKGLARDIVVVHEAVTGVRYDRALAQGTVNIAEGTGNAVIRLINDTAEDIVNPHGLIWSDGIVPDIPQSNWAEGMFIYEDPAWHRASSTIGGESVLLLLSLKVPTMLDEAVVRLRAPRRARGLKCAGDICFAAGTPVLVPGADGEVTIETAALATPGRSWREGLIPGAVVLAGMSGWYVDERRTRRRQACQESTLDTLFPPGEGGDPSEDEDSCEEDSRFLEGAADDISPPWPQEDGCELSSIAAPTACVVRADRPCRGRSGLLAGRAAALPTPVQSPRAGRTSRGWGRWWLAACLLLASFLGASTGLLPTGSRSIDGERPGVSMASPASQVVEDIRVGQRVIARFAGAETSSPSVPTSVDPAAWRLLRLHAEERWPDGTLDTIEIDTIQPPEWIEQHRARPGATVPIPLDLVEMGLREGLLARVVANEPCPPIPTGPGCVVLTTVNHLNSDVYELTFGDGQGQSQTVRPTGLHKFYSQTRGDWVSARDLRQGEQLRGLGGVLCVEGIRAIPGVHRVYNFTVEGEHCYRVSTLGALVHNNGCNPKLPKVGESSRPKNLTPEGAGRSGAFRQAKADAGIPRSQQPSAVRTVPDRTNPGRIVREYDFDVPRKGGGTRRITIQEHQNGHNFGLNDPQNRGPHFNTPDGGHYDY